jgi:hypothetical protein
MASLGRSPGAAPLTSADIPDNSITSAKIVAGTVAASDVAADVATQAELDAVSTTVTANEADADKIQTNIAMLGFKVAVNGSLAKYNLQDQVIDEYTDATGVDDVPSNNHTLTAGVYQGQATTTPTVTQDADATGVDGVYTWYKWTDTAATGSYTSSITENHEYLVVAGGGGGGEGYYGGGGGAGGYLVGASVSYASASTFTITVGAGGTGGATQTGPGANGGVSSIVSSGSETTVSSTGGGGGAGRNQVGGAVAQAGGSGGGASMPGYNGGTGVSGQGYDGGDCASSNYGAGGGGAGFIGNDGTGNPYGAIGAHGLQNDIAGSNIYYAGGGAGGGETAKAGGNGGGGAGGDNPGLGGDATDGLGGGGGGGGGNAADGGDGGNGIVILRRQTQSLGADNLTLQSTDTEAEAQPTKADMVMLIEDAGSGVGTVNTHIKGHISRDSGTTFTEGVLVDEGDWGTDKRILAFHDLDISSQPADQTMCYKITTHSASAVYDTKIHATSIGWR